MKVQFYYIEAVNPTRLSPSTRPKSTHNDCSMLLPMPTCETKKVLLLSQRDLPVLEYVLDAQSQELL